MDFYERFDKLEKDLGKALCFLGKHEWEYYTTYWTGFCECTHVYRCKKCGNTKRKF